jgi:hypothetical protein
MILPALLALQAANSGYKMRQVRALDVPLPLEAGAKAIDFFSGSDAAHREAAERRGR